MHSRTCSCLWCSPCWYSQLVFTRPCGIGHWLHFEKETKLPILSVDAAGEIFFLNYVVSSIQCLLQVPSTRRKINHNARVTTKKICNGCICEFLALQVTPVISIVTSSCYYQIHLYLQLWQCGGQMVDAPCSRVGHIYRKFAPFPNPGVGDFVGRVSFVMRISHSNQSIFLLCFNR